MPGIVVFKRRWSVGSDDLVVPAVFLVLLHVVWVVVLAVTLGVVEFDPMIECAVHLKQHVLGYIVILSGCVLLEATIAGYAMRGTILDTDPRTGMQYMLYVRLGVLLVEVVWLVIGVVWVSQHYASCTAIMAKRAILGIIVCNWVILLSVLLSLWCTFDTAGRSWVKMKRYQESLKEKEGRPGHKRRSGSRRRNWRQRKHHSTMSIERATRKAMRAYEQSWDRRCGTLFCCVKEDRHRSSFTEVAKLFTEFFRDLDVVPTDIVAGLVLLRKNQKLRRKCVVAQGTNEVYQFLSGVPIKPTTRFLSLKSPADIADYKKVVKYMRYALGAYGWPMYMMMNTGTGLCKIMPHLRCCSCCCCSCCGGESNNPGAMVTDDCCECNFAAMRKLSGLKALDVIYCTYHVDIGETPFFVALDHADKKVVISIRGTLSLQDVLTDLKADAEQLPVEPLKEDWLGHKGIVQAAVYIKKKIKDEMLLSRAFSKDPEQGTPSYELVLVGHSLGAGTAAILAILLQAEHPNLHCYAYSPPGGLLSEKCVEDTKEFITSVVVGKDVVPRIGLHQLEAMRQDLINVIKNSTDPKWKIITGSMMCCCGRGEHEEMTSENEQSYLQTYAQQKQDNVDRYFTHPSDDQISLTTHTPLYLPGKIIHVVRNHPKESRRLCGREEPVYQAVLAENMENRKYFNEVLISPTMINDHMPDNVLEALEKVLTKVSPAKPSRKYSEAERRAMLSDAESAYEPSDLPQEPLIENSEAEEEDGVWLEEQGGGGGGVGDEEQQREPKPDVVIAATATTEDAPPPPLRSPHPHQTARHVKALSYPAPSCVLRPTRLDILARDDLNGPFAPLATPETLSETSSLESVSSQGSSRKFGKLSYQKLTSTVPRLQPIQQSPLRHTRSDGYCYFLSQPSPVEYPDSPNKCFGILSKSEEVRPTMSDDETLASVETPYPNSSLTEASLPSRKVPAKLVFVSETSKDFNNEYVKHSPDSPESGSQLIPEYNPGDLGYHAGGRGYPGFSYLPGIVELSPEASPGTDAGLAESSFLDSTHQDTDNLLSSMEELPTDAPPQEEPPMQQTKNGSDDANRDFLLDSSQREGSRNWNTGEELRQQCSMKEEGLDTKDTDLLLDISSKENSLTAQEKRQAGQTQERLATTDLVDHNSHVKDTKLKKNNSLGSKECLDSRDTDLLLDNVDIEEECIAMTDTRLSSSVPRDYLDRDLLSQSTDISGTQSISQATDVLSPEEKFKSDLESDFMTGQRENSLKDSHLPTVSSMKQGMCSDDRYESHLLDTLEEADFSNEATSPIHYLDRLNESYESEQSDQNPPPEPSYEENLLDTLEKPAVYENTLHRQDTLESHDGLRHLDSKGYQADTEDNFTPPLEARQHSFIDAFPALADNPPVEYCGSQYPVLPTRSNHHRGKMFSEEPALSMPTSQVPADRNNPSCNDMSDSQTEQEDCGYMCDRDRYEVDLLNLLEPDETANNDMFNDSFEDGTPFQALDRTPLSERENSQSLSERENSQSQGTPFEALDRTPLSERESSQSQGCAKSKDPSHSSASSGDDGISVHSSPTSVDAGISSSPLTNNGGQHFSQPFDEEQEQEVVVEDTKETMFLPSEELPPSTTPSAATNNHNAIHVSNSIHDEEHNDLLSSKSVDTSSALTPTPPAAADSLHAGPDNDAGNVNQNCSSGVRTSMSAGEQFLQELVAIAGSPLQESQV